MRHGKQVLKGLSCLVLADGVEKPSRHTYQNPKASHPARRAIALDLLREAPLCPRMLDAVAAFPDSLTKENEFNRTQHHTIEAKPALYQ